MELEGGDHQKNKQHDGRIPVAYAITVSSCRWSIIDAAAVHGYAIDRIQEQSPRYSHRRYAFVHSTAIECAEKLRHLGYYVMILDTPVNVAKIKTRLRREIEVNGCCGSKELMKLYTYILEEPVAIHLDTDTLLLQSIDELFDAVLGSELSAYVHTEGNASLPADNAGVHFMFTRDYLQGSTISFNTSKWGVQGGMFVVKPSHDQFEAIVRVVEKGQYTPLHGWGGQLFGGYWGAAQIQGLLSYVYSDNPSAVELNRCVYNNMHDHMYFEVGRRKGYCTTLQPNCTNNCRKIPFEDIKLAHLTQCTKPWTCSVYSDGFGLCTKFFDRWFQLRQELEQEWFNFHFEPPEEQFWFYNVSRGYCHQVLKPAKKQKPGSRFKKNSGGYTPLKIPLNKKQ